MAQRSIFKQYCNAFKRILLKLITYTELWLDLFPPTEGYNYPQHSQEPVKIKRSQTTRRLSPIKYLTNHNEHT